MKEYAARLNDIMDEVGKEMGCMGDCSKCAKAREAGVNYLGEKLYECRRSDGVYTRKHTIRVGCERYISHEDAKLQKGFKNLPLRHPLTPLAVF